MAANLTALSLGNQAACAKFATLSPADPGIEALFFENGRDRSFAGRHDIGEHGQDRP